MLYKLKSIEPDKRHHDYDGWCDTESYCQKLPSHILFHFDYGHDVDKIDFYCPLHKEHLHNKNMGLTSDYRSCNQHFKVTTENNNTGGVQYGKGQDAM